MVCEYILKNWKNTIRDTSHKGHGMVALPKPFSTPSIELLFEDFYYWDTYFINLGLLTDGFVEQAKNNLDNIAYFIRHMRRVGLRWSKNHFLYGNLYTGLKERHLFSFRGLFGFWGARQG